MVKRNRRGAGSVRNAVEIPKESAPAQFVYGSWQAQWSHHMRFCTDSVAVVSPSRAREETERGTCQASEIVRSSTLSRDSMSVNLDQNDTAESAAGVLAPPGPSSFRYSSPVCWRNR